MEEFERLSAIKPWKSVKFNLEDVPKALIDDRNLINRIRDDVNEFKHYGASHSWSIFQIHGIVDATMSDENAAVIISHLDAKKYFF